ncbi:MAG: pro-sigmaK processing inhibitor BofA family protein [archaeon]|jgi:hypothetical protein
MVDVIIIGPIITILLAIIIIFIVLKFGKSIAWLIINSLIGLAALLIVNLLPIVNITINIWSILIVALGGLFGLILLILLSVLHIAF